MNNGSAALSTIVQSIVSFIFPTILFGLKFIEWWYSPDKEDTIRKITQLPIPPAPPVIQVSNTGGTRYSHINYTIIYYWFCSSV